MTRFYLAVILALIPVSAFAAERDGFEVSKIYLNEGNNRTPIAVALSSSAWTEVLPSSITRRSAIIHTLSTADATICLSTTSVSTTKCLASLPGLHMEKGGSMVDNSESVLYGRVADGAADIAAYAVYAYGMIFKDSKDAGDETN